METKTVPEEMAGKKDGHGQARGGESSSDLGVLDPAVGDKSGFAAREAGPVLDHKGGSGAEPVLLDWGYVNNRAHRHIP